MTAESVATRHTPYSASLCALAARFAPERLLCSDPHNEEGAGNAGCWPHPWPACRKKAGGSHHRFSRDIRHSPRDSFNGLYVLSSGTGLFAPVSRQRARRVALGLSTGRPGPHDFTVRTRIV